VHLITNLGGPGNAPQPTPGDRLVASIDVGWTRDHRVLDGHRAYCYSIIWLILPASPEPITLDAGLAFDYTSVYLDHHDERPQLVAAAAADLDAALNHADLIAGHQLPSDLAALRATATADINTGAVVPPAVTAAQHAWRQRRTDPARRIVDARFDTDHVLFNASRQLVDICAELDLDVAEAELTDTTVAALNRAWLVRRDSQAREQVTVLNLRTCLATAYVALRAAGLATWHHPLNVNAMLSAQLDYQLGWLHSPAFRALAHRRHRP